MSDVLFSRNWWKFAALINAAVFAAGFVLGALIF